MTVIAPVLQPQPQLQGGGFNPVAPVGPSRPGDRFTGSDELTGNPMAASMGIPNFGQALGGSLADGILKAGATQVVQGLQQGQDVSQQAQQLMQQYQLLKAQGMPISPQVEELVKKALEMAGLGQVGGPQAQAPQAGGGAPQSGGGGGSPVGGGGSPQAGGGGSPVGGGGGPQAGGGSQSGEGSALESNPTPRSEQPQTTTAPEEADRVTTSDVPRKTESTTLQRTAPTELPKSTTGTPASPLADPKLIKDPVAAQSMGEWLASMQPGQQVQRPQFAGNAEMLKSFSQGPNDNCSVTAVAKAAMDPNSPETLMTRTENGLQIRQPDGNVFDLSQEQLEKTAKFSGFQGSDSQAVNYANAIVAGMAARNQAQADPALGKADSFDKALERVANPKTHDGKSKGERYWPAEAAAAGGYKLEPGPVAPGQVKIEASSPDENGRNGHAATKVDGKQDDLGSLKPVEDGKVVAPSGVERESRQSGKLGRGDNPHGLRPSQPNPRRESTTKSLTKPSKPPRSSTGSASTKPSQPKASKPASTSTKKAA